MMDQTNSSNQRYFRIKEEDRQEISMTNIIMIREIIKIGIDQIVEIGEFHLVVEYSEDEIIETDQDMKRIIEMIVGETFPLLEEILEVMWEPIRIRMLEDKIIEVDI